MTQVWTVTVHQLRRHKPQFWIEAETCEEALEQVQARYPGERVTARRRHWYVRQ